MLLLHLILYTHCRRCEPGVTKVSTYSIVFGLTQQIYYNTWDSATKSSMTSAWHPLDTGISSFLRAYVCFRDILLHLYLVIILPYVCSRDMLQLFDKGLIGFSNSHWIYLTVNACVCQNHDFKIEIAQLIKDNCPYRTALVLSYRCSAGILMCFCYLVYEGIAILWMNSWPCCIGWKFALSLLTHGPTEWRKP